MKSIRKNVFETNSSSTHSLCITSNNLLDEKQNFVLFQLGEFGWEHDKLSSVEEKASYLYTGIMYNNLDERLLPKLKEILDKNEIKYEFESDDSDFYYIDHAEELDDFLKDICNDENKLMRFLFSSESFILTGNDNSSLSVDINVDYDHEEYYKGN